MLKRSIKNIKVDDKSSELNNFILRTQKSIMKQSVVGGANDSKNSNAIKNLVVKNQSMMF